MFVVIDDYLYPSLCRSTGVVDDVQTTMSSFILSEVVSSRDWHRVVGGTICESKQSVVTKYSCCLKVIFCQPSAFMPCKQTHFICLTQDCLSTVIVFFTLVPHIAHLFDPILPLRTKTEMVSSFAFPTSDFHRISRQTFRLANLTVLKLLVARSLCCCLLNTDHFLKIIFPHHIFNFTKRVFPYFSTPMWSILFLCLLEQN